MKAFQFSFRNIGLIEDPKESLETGENLHTKIDKIEVPVYSNVIPLCPQKTHVLLLLGNLDMKFPLFIESCEKNNNSILISLYKDSQKYISFHLKGNMLWYLAYFPKAKYHLYCDNIPVLNFEVKS